MFLEIVSPEAILFSSEIDALSAPGLHGEFQMLNNHASIVAVLKQGTVKIQGTALEVDRAFEQKFAKDGDALLLDITSGTLEMKDNKVIILAD